MASWRTREWVGRGFFFPLPSVCARVREASWPCLSVSDLAHLRRRLQPASGGVVAASPTSRHRRRRLQPLTMGLRDLLFKRGYEEALEGKPDALAKRLEKYGTICQLGIANLFWKGTTLVFKDMKTKEDPHLLHYITIFTVCLLLMTMGMVASQFPDTSPFPSFTSGLGALVAILSMFGSYHLDLLEYFPSPWDCSASMISMGLAFTLYWAYAVQDPWFVHLLAKLLDWLIPFVCFCGCSIWKCVWTNGVSRWPDGIKVWFEKQKARWPGSIKKKRSDESLLAKDLLN